ncbi:hypothetical protein [Hyella patelloides]|uniref:hypothetical protein n=1 Tax=Hyella patelloides TaxID=1982969 RepID=UPI0011A0E2BA|nr:hypothetical protein [Hyella patelloides]
MLGRPQHIQFLALGLTRDHRVTAVFPQEFTLSRDGDTPRLRSSKAPNSITIGFIPVLNELLIEGNPQDRTRSLNQQRQKFKIEKTPIKKLPTTTPT